MKKFFILLQKEIKELITPQLVLPLIIMTLIFAFIGNLIGHEKEKISAPQDIAIVDEDKTETSKAIIQTLAAANFKIVNLEEKNVDEIFKNNNKISMAVFVPQGLETGIKNLEPQKIEIYNNIKSFSLLASVKNIGVKQIMEFVNQSTSNKILSEKIRNIDPEYLKNPIQANEFVIINGRKANVAPAEVMNFLMSQTIFIPIILFMVIIMAAQMVATTVATEKENKTLETLLSSPISRKTIVLAKITGSGLVALIFSGVYMLGFNSYIKGLTGNAMQVSNPNLSSALSTLGLNITPTGYVLLGASLFLAILCALAIAIILGILAEDVKGVQAVITPLMLMIMVPYFLTLFFDINSVSPVLKYLIYAIPFSHPFLASQNLIMHNFFSIFGGILYQLLIFIILITIASKIFSSDKILTIKLRFKKRT